MSDFDNTLLSNTLDRLLEAGYSLADIEAKVVRWLQDNQPVTSGVGGPATAYVDPDPKSYYENVVMGGDWS